VVWALLPTNLYNVTFDKNIVSIFTPMFSTLKTDKQVNIHSYKVIPKSMSRAIKLHHFDSVRLTHEYIHKEMKCVKILNMLNANVQFFILLHNAVYLLEYHKVLCLIFVNCIIFQTLTLKLQNGS
jgi:hypothetical protein